MFSAYCLLAYGGSLLISEMMSPTRMPASAASFRNALGQSVSNALAYVVPANGYTIKDKIGYPLKQTPTFSKYNDVMLKCEVRTFKNAI